MKIPTMFIFLLCVNIMSSLSLQALRKKVAKQNNEFGTFFNQILLKRKMGYITSIRAIITIIRNLNNLSKYNEMYYFKNSNHNKTFDKFDKAFSEKCKIFSMKNLTVSNLNSHLDEMAAQPLFKTILLTENRLP